MNVDCPSGTTTKIMAKKEGNNHALINETPKVIVQERNETGAKRRKTKNLTHPYDQTIHKTRSKSGESSLPPLESTMISMVTQKIVDSEHVDDDNNDIMETEQNNNDILPNKETIMQTDKINDPKKKID